jgi:hypothetical protein
MASGQGFGVKALGTGTVTFNNSMRVTGSNNDFRTPENSDRQRIWLDLKNDAYGLSSNMLVAFTRGATDAFERKYDSRKLDTPISLFSVIKSNEMLAIQGRSSFSENQVVQLGFSTQIEEKQSYTISIRELEGEIISNTTVYLEDKLLNTITNLSKENYTFISNVAEQKERFVLFFKNNRSSLGVEEESLQAISIYPNPFQTTININSPNVFFTEYSVIDMQGRLLIKEKFEATNSKTIQVSELSNATYFVRIFTENGTLTKQLIKK